MAKAKVKSVFFCSSCGYESPKWLGKCPGCNEWNSFTEEQTSKTAQTRKSQGFLTTTTEKPFVLSEISLSETPRFKTGINELDRVLGSGLVPGTLTLLGGDPGIGKSTLVLQLVHQIFNKGKKVLYVTGEESKEQIKLRAERLDVSSDFLVLAENDQEQILKHVQSTQPELLIIDSIQTVYNPHLESAPGTVSQVRECTAKLLQLAKQKQVATILIGHVTKEGSLAGPRVLEHMVDCVLYFEGENTGQFRILRTVKNRYGSTNEIGVFQMTEEGLKEVTNPSQVFLGERSQEKTGACITATLEGTRSLLVEIQSLVCPSPLATPRRTTIGLEPGRTALIVAVIEKILGFKLYDQDLYISASGGLKIHEPASDLAAMISMISSFLNKPIPGDLIAFGEISLSGEIRAVSHIEKRIEEAQKLGYNTVIVPKSSKIDTSKYDAKIIPVAHVSEVSDALF